MAVFLALCRPAAAEELTLSGLFEIVGDDHPMMRQEELSTEIARKSREMALAARSWTIRSSPYYYYSRPVEPSSFTPEEIQELVVAGSAGKSFWSTGGRFSVEWSSKLTDQELPGIAIPSPAGVSSFSLGLNEFYRNRIFLSYSQPLWRNFGGSLDRLEYDLGGYLVDMSGLEAAENREAFLLRLGMIFIDWVLLAEKEEILEERLRLAREELGFVEEKREAFLVDPVDVLRAEDAVRMAEQNLTLLRSNLTAARVRLAELTLSPGIAGMTPRHPLYETSELPDSAEVFADIRRRSRRLSALRQQKLRLQRLRRGYSERSKPELDLGLGAGLIGGDGRFHDSFAMTEPEYRISLIFSWPLGGRAAEIGESRTLVEIRRIDLRHEHAVQELRSGLSDILVRIGEMEEILRINRSQIESAGRRMEEEQKMYRQGRGQLNFVIQSRDNLQNAKLIYAENAAAYQRLLLRYRELTDRIIERPADDGN